MSTLRIPRSGVTVRMRASASLGEPFESVGGDLLMRPTFFESAVAAVDIDHPTLELQAIREAVRAHVERYLASTVRVLAEQIASQIVGLPPRSQF